MLPPSFGLPCFPLGVRKGSRGVKSYSGEQYSNTLELVFIGIARVFSANIADDRVGKPWNPSSIPSDFRLVLVKICLKIHAQILWIQALIKISEAGALARKTNLKNPIYKIRFIEILFFASMCRLRVLEFVWKLRKWRIFKAIPHRDCRVQTRSQLFRQIVQNDAGIPAYFKEFWAKMTEKMQAYARQSAQRGLCAVLP